MVTLIDSLDTRPRHPEKANRPENEMLRKPDWIRVKAPVSKGYAETREIVRAHGGTIKPSAGCTSISTSRTLTLFAAQARPRCPPI